MRDLFKIDFGVKRLYGLDIMRALAIIFVVAAHGANLLPKRTWQLHDILLVDGVFVFFVLSGFLIGGILIKILEAKKHRVHDLIDFWVRRWFRIIPAYFLILTVLIFIRLIFYGGFHGIPVWRYFFFVQNLTTPHPLFFSEAWTLSIEEWFYLLVPILLFIMVRFLKLRVKRAMLLSIIAITVASMAFRYARFSSQHLGSVTDWDLYFRKEVFTRLDSIMFGVLGAYFAFYYKTAWLRHKVALFWGGLAIIILQQAAAMYIVLGNHIAETGAGVYLTVFSFVAAAIGALMLIPYLTTVKTGTGKVYSALTTISISSYSMYLIHVSLVQPFVYSVTRVPTTHLLMLVRYVLYWGLTIGISILLYKYFERPMTDLRERFVRKKKQSAGPPI